MESITLVTEFANKKVSLSHQTTHNFALQTVNNSSRCAGWTAKVLVITMKLGLWERCSSKCRPQTSSKGNQSNYVAKWTGLAMTIDYGWANIHLLAVIKVGNWINAKLRAVFLQRKGVALTALLWYKKAGSLQGHCEILVEMSDLPIIQLKKSTYIMKGPLQSSLAWLQRWWTTRAAR